MPIATPQGTLDFKSVDTITFVGASSNTVIDTTTGSLGVGVDGNGPTSNLHVVGHTRLEGDINMLHTANTASIKLNSNVVTEFPRSKKLIKYPRVALTGYSQDGYVVNASSLRSGHEAWHVFDDTKYASGVGRKWASEASQGDTFTGGDSLYNGTNRLSSSTQDGAWLKIELPHKIRLQYISLFSDPTSEQPEDFIIYGSNDDNTWDQLFQKTGATANADYVNYTINSVSCYKYFGLVVRRLISSTTIAAIDEWKLFGTPEHDPDADGVDVVVKSLPNVPNTDWLEVYYDAKDLADGALSTASGAITGLGGTTNSGTAYGGVTVSDGAFVLDGTNDYITTSALGFSGDQPYSISIWFRSDRPQTDMTTENGIYGFGYGNNLTAGLSWWSPVTNGSSSLRHWHSGSAGKNFPNTTFLEDMWNHIVIVYPGGGAFNIRAWLNDVELMGVNGTGSGGVNNDFSWSTSDSIIIGDWYNTSGPRLQSPWDGKIANFRLFNRVLTQDEIYQLYAYQKEYFGHGDLSMTLKAGRLGIGTSEPKAALDVRGNLRASGTIVQVKSSLKTDNSSTSSATEVDIAHLSVNIIPKFSTSKMLVSYTVNVGTGNGHGFLRVKRTQGGVSTYIGDGYFTSGNRKACTSYIFCNVGQQCESYSFEHLDDVNGTEPITYQVQFGVLGSTTYTLHINRSGSDGNNSYYGRVSSSITVKEVCQ